MTGDQGSEILKRAFSQERPPLTESQRQTARKACAFALVAFSSQWEGEWLIDWLKQRNVELTPKQIAFATNLRQVFPEPDEVLPVTEFNSAEIGYYNLAATPIGEIIPSLLKHPDKAHFGEYEMATNLMKEDPTGIAYLQRLLSDMEEKATVNGIGLKEDEVRAKIAGILAAAQDVPDEPKPQKPLDDWDVSDSVLNAFMSTFGGNKTQRQEFIEKSREALKQEAPMELDEKGQLLPSNVLEVMGARLAFDRWQTGVNAYLNRWGNQTSDRTST